MDLASLGQCSLSWSFCGSILSIILIDVLLSGDNAVVIAMAVRSLPEEKRRQGMLAGAGAAIVLRIVLTFFAAQLLRLSFVKLIGGVLILWIAAKLLLEDTEEEGGHREAHTIWHALWMIVVADLSMSLDNVLAVAGASKGNLFLLLFGLGMSIPFLLVSASVLSKLMDRFPAIIYAGAVILGKVGGEMIVTDPTVERLLHPSKPMEYGVQAFCAVAVIAVPKIVERVKGRKVQPSVGVAND